MLLDSEAYARGSSCTIDGPCHVTNMPGEHEDISDGTSEDSRQSSSSPVHRKPGQHSAAAGRTPQKVTRAAFKAAAAARGPAATGCMNGILPGASAAAHLRPFGGPASPFGSSNASAAGSPFDFEVDDLVHTNMCVQDRAKAAALFPAEEGPFARPQPMQYGRY